MLVDAVGGEHMVNGTCVERMLKDVLPVVRVLVYSPSTYFFPFSRPHSCTVVRGAFYSKFSTQELQ